MEREVQRTLYIIRRDRLPLVSSPDRTLQPSFMLASREDEGEGSGEGGRDVGREGIMGGGGGAGRGEAKRRGGGMKAEVKFEEKE